MREGGTSSDSSDDSDDLGTDNDDFVDTEPVTSEDTETDTETTQ
jgi:hypothetical protein